jgi:hypothetical protein
MSSDSLIEYCSAQLNCLDSDIKTHLDNQKALLREHDAAASVKTALEQYGTDGPKNGQQMETCIKAIDDACASLPAGDPLIAKLIDEKSKLILEYGYTAPQAAGSPQQLTQEEEQQLQQAKDDLARFPAGAPDDPGLQNEYNQDQLTVSNLLAKENGTAPGADANLSKVPLQGQWQGTLEAFDNIAQSVKSSAEIDMLQLQDLVSQRGQAIQIASGIMGKYDQALEDLAKGIGR